MNTEKIKVSVQSEGVNKDLTADFVCVMAFSNDENGARMHSLAYGGGYPVVIVKGFMNSLANFISDDNNDADMEELLLTLVGKKVVNMMEDFDERHPDRHPGQNDKDKLDITVNAISAEDAAEMLKKIIEGIREGK